LGGKSTKGKRGMNNTFGYCLCEKEEVIETVAAPIGKEIRK